MLIGRLEVGFYLRYLRTRYYDAALEAVFSCSIEPKLSEEPSFQKPLQSGDNINILNQTLKPQPF